MEDKISERYNDEEKEIDLLELMKTIWKRRKFVGLWCLCGIVLGLVIAFSIPKEYTTSVMLAPEVTDSKSGSGGLGALAAMAGVNLSAGSADAMSPQLYPDIVKSVPFALSLLDVPLTNKEGKSGFTVRDYLENDTESPWWSAITGLPGQILGALSGKQEEEGPAVETEDGIITLSKDEVKYLKALEGAVAVSVDQKTFVITVDVTLQDPLCSAILADSVTSQLKEYIVDYRTNKARKDLAYVEKLNNEAKEKYYKAQQKYAAYLDANQGIVLYSAQTMRDRLENETTLAFNMFNQTSQQLQLAQAKVQEVTPVFATIDPPTVPVKPSAPRKVLILAGFTFLAGVFACAWVLFIDPIRKKEKEEREEKEEADSRDRKDRRKENE